MIKILRLSHFHSIAFFFFFHSPGRNSEKTGDSRERVSEVVKMRSVNRKEFLFSAILSNVTTERSF